MASCCQAVSCHQHIVNTLFNVSISKSDNINKFWVGIFYSQSRISQVFRSSLTDFIDWVSIEVGRQWSDSSPIETIVSGSLQNIVIFSLLIQEDLVCTIFCPNLKLNLRRRRKSGNLWLHATYLKSQKAGAGETILIQQLLYHHEEYKKAFRNYLAGFYSTV